jgi:hypothetical protein
MNWKTGKTTLKEVVNTVTINNTISFAEAPDAISPVGFLPVLPEIVSLFAEVIFVLFEVFALSVEDVVTFVVLILISTHNVNRNSKDYNVASTFRDV